MKLHDASASGSHTFTAYGAAYVAVNGVSHHRSLIVSPTHLDDAWPVTSVADLSADALARIPAENGTIVLLGTGSRQRFPAPQLLRPLLSAGVAIEVMDNFAACRTYNILAAEGRQVVAALIVEAGA